MQPKTAPISVLILDDHPLIRQGVSALLGLEKEFVVGGEAEDVPSALALLKKQPVDLVLLDIGLKDADGLVALKEIKAHHPAVKVLIFSGQEEIENAPRFIRAGASGYIMKGAPHEVFLTALRKVAAGHIYLSSELETQFLKGMVAGRTSPFNSPVEALSDRELEIFTLFGQGLRGKDIAEKLNISIKTIDAHRGHIKEKLRIESHAEFMHRAIAWVQRNAP